MLREHREGFHPYTHAFDWCDKPPAAAGHRCKCVCFAGPLARWRIAYQVAGTLEGKDWRVVGWFLLNCGCGHQVEELESLVVKDFLLGLSRYS
jgi:hypothetical protein